LWTVRRTRLSRFGAPPESLKEQKALVVETTVQSRVRPPYRWKSTQAVNVATSWRRTIVETGAERRGNMGWLGTAAPSLVAPRLETSISELRTDRKRRLFDPRRPGSPPPRCSTTPSVWPLLGLGPRFVRNCKWGPKRPAPLGGAFGAGMPWALAARIADTHGKPGAAAPHFRTALVGNVVFGAVLGTAFFVARWRAQTSFARTRTYWHLSWRSRALDGAEHGAGRGGTGQPPFGASARCRRERSSLSVLPAFVLL